MPAPVALLSLATASPPHQMPQAQVAEVARRLFEDKFPQFDRMAKVFGAAGIASRQSVLPMDWYLQPRSWPERTEACLAGGVDLFVDAAQAALDESGLKGADVDIIVILSSTGIAAP